MPPLAAKRSTKENPSELVLKAGAAGNLVLSSHSGRHRSVRFLCVRVATKHFQCCMSLFRIVIVLLACNREVLRICPEKLCAPGQRGRHELCIVQSLATIANVSLNGLPHTSNRDTKGSCRDLRDGGEPRMVTSSSQVTSMWGTILKRICVIHLEPCREVYSTVRPPAGKLSRLNLAP